MIRNNSVYLIKPAELVDLAVTGHAKIHMNDDTKAVDELFRIVDDVVDNVREVTLVAAINGLDKVTVNIYYLKDSFGDYYIDWSRTLGVVRVVGLIMKEEL